MHNGGWMVALRKGALPMSKTSLSAALSAAALMSVAIPVFAAQAGQATSDARHANPVVVAGFNAWDGHAIAPNDSSLGGGAAWSDGLVAPANEAPRTGDLGANGGAAKLTSLTPAAADEALPLSQFSGDKLTSSHNGLGMWDIVNSVRYGRLPEPASWALMLIGFGMIGGAMRGFVVANQRIGCLQPEDGGED